MAFVMSVSVVVPPVVVPSQCPWAGETACHCTFTSVAPPTRYLTDRIETRAGRQGHFKQPNPPCLRTAAPVPALRCEQLAGKSARPLLRLQPSGTFQAASPGPAPRLRRSATVSAQTRLPETPPTRHDAPGPAPLRRGRPARRREEVDARDDPSHGAGARGAAPADGGPEGPEGAREAE